MYISVPWKNTDQGEQVNKSVTNEFKKMFVSVILLLSVILNLPLNRVSACVRVCVCYEVSECVFC